MDTQEEESCEHYKLLEKLNSAATRAIQNVEAIRKKGGDAVCRAETTFSITLKDKVNEHTTKVLSNFIEKLLRFNIDIELIDEDSLTLTIPYISPGKNRIELKFLMGDNPWNFWLCDDEVDTRSIHKMLLKKYQSNLLEPYLYAKPQDSVCFYDRNKVFRGIVLHTVNEDRLRLLDCDSNAIRVVAKNNVFKVDTDACDKHASAIKCTISKDSTALNLWTNDLRDVFWNVLKEAILQVTILERLSGPFPSFVVDIDLRNEDNDSVGNLNNWIMDKLLPEVKKCTLAEGSVIEFLSSEALDPYCKIQNYVENTDMINKNPTDTCRLLTKAQEQKGNSFHSRDFADTLIQNIQSNSEKPNKDKSEIITNNTTQQTSSLFIETANDCDSSIDNKHICESNSVLPNEVKELNLFNGKSTVNLPASSNISPITTNNDESNPSSENKHQMLNYDSNYIKSRSNHSCHSKTLNHGYPSSVIGQSLMYTGPPRHSSNYGRNTHSMPPMPLQYNAPNTNLTMSDSSVALPFSSPKKTIWSSGNWKSSNNTNENFNVLTMHNNLNVTVNVMAPEFIPQKSGKSQIADTCNENARSQSPALPDHSPALISIRENLHVELKKPTSLLTPGENLMVMIAHVETPYEFYVHFITNNNQHIDKLLSNMFSEYNLSNMKIFNSWREAKATLGKFCACKWPEDNYWYRAEVLDWTVEENQVKVFFVDYGNTVVVPLSCLQPLKPQFTKLSMCAQLCHLAKIRPVNNQEIWSEESLLFFKSKIDDSRHRAYTIIVVPSSQKKIKVNSLSVLLYEGKANGDSVSVNDEMVDCGFAWSTKFTPKSQSTENELFNASDEISEATLSDASTIINSTSIAEQLQMPIINSTVDYELEENFDSWDPLAEDYFSNRNDPRLNTDDACIAVSGYSAKDEARICKFFAREGICKKNYCIKEHTLPNKDGTTTDLEAVYSKVPSEVALPSVGEIIEVKVTSVIDLSIFYIQLKETAAIDSDMYDESETLTGLIQFINEEKNIQNMKFLQIPPSMGQLVLAKSDDVWHRARVITVEDYEVEVMFVDFGSISSVKEADLREMEPQYLHLPFQAIECTIANIAHPLNKEDANRGIELLKEAIELQVLTAKVVSSSWDNTNPYLELMLDSEYGDVGEYLITNHCALPFP